MNENLEKIVNNILKNKREDWIHGLPHVKRVLWNFELFVKDSEISQEDKIALECAVYLHDLGRIDDGPGHAERSVAIIKKDLDIQKELNERCNSEKKDWVIYAIENHSGKKPYDISDKKGLFSTFLILLDVIDTVGIIGITRGIAWMHYVVDNPIIFPKENKEIERVNELLDSPEKRNEEDKEKNKSSIIQHLVDNYAFCQKFFNDLVKNNKLGDNFKKEIEKRLSFTKNFIKELIIEGNN
jgi:hypothetical protein